MMTTSRDSVQDSLPQSEHVADAVARTLLAHPSVVRLDTGEFGVIATQLPGRELTGVRVRTADDSVEVAVVLRPDRPLPEIITELRHQVAEVAGNVPVDITVSDVQLAEGQP